MVSNRLIKMQGGDNFTVHATSFTRETAGQKRSPKRINWGTEKTSCHEFMDYRINNLSKLFRFINLHLWKMLSSVSIKKKARKKLKGNYKKKPLPLKMYTSGIFVYFSNTSHFSNNLKFLPIWYPCKNFIYAYHYIGYFIPGSRQLRVS